MTRRYVLLVNRGVMRVRKPDHRAAIDDFRAAIALKPGRFQAYLDLAQEFRSLGRLDECSPRSIVPWHRNRATGCCTDSEARSKSYVARMMRLRDFDRASRLSPANDRQSADLYMESGRIAQRKKQYPEALAAYDRAIPPARSGDRPPPPGGRPDGNQAI